MVRFPIIYGNVGQYNNTWKEISNIRTEKDEKRLPLFADIMFIYIEKNNQITKLRVLQTYKIQVLYQVEL